MRRRHLAALICLTMSAAPCQGSDDEHHLRGAEGPHAYEHAVHLPEPLVFDLVRSLGARRGELEVNVLGQFPIGGTDNRKIHWAPEVEGAVSDGIALEFELPFEGAELEAYKIAGQGTFGTALDNRFIHGTQGIAEYEIDDELWELSLLYLAGHRFGEVWSLLAIVGPRTKTGGDQAGDFEALVNLNVFADIGPVLTIGFETNYSSGLGQPSKTLLMPQVQREVTDNFMIQGGLGAVVRSDDTLAEAALRVIYTF